MKKIFLFSFINLTLFGQVSDKLTAGKPLQMNGYLAEKLDKAYQNRILAQSVDKLVDPFKIRNEATCWQSEFWGKWITSALLAYEYKPTPALKAKLDEAVRGLIATQTAEGYIGNYQPDKQLQGWDIWGRKYCLLGLIGYYDLTRDAQSLATAQRLANHLIGELQEKNLKIVKQGNHRGMAATSVLEPIMLLYTRTKDKKYLNFAEEIVKQWETDGPQLLSKSTIPVANRFPKPTNWWGWEQGQKAYEMMSCYEGLLELYRTTGKPQYLKAVENTWKSINETEINIAGSGGAMECWFGGKLLQTRPIEHYQETCVTATWVKLNQQLLRLTGEAKYADAIEKTYYNALLGAMTDDGSDWSKYMQLDGQKRPGGEHCGMGLNCCVASGPRGLFTLPKTILMADKQGITLNFYTDGTFQTYTPQQQMLRVVQETNYPISGKTVIRLQLAKPEKFMVTIRIPEWNTKATIRYGDKIFESKEHSTFLAIEKNWENNDEIIIDFEMKGKVLSLNNSIALQRGPIVLSRDSRLGLPSVDETITPVLNKDGDIDVEIEPNPTEGFWLVAQVPVLLESYLEHPPTPVKLRFGNFSSAGNTYTADSRYRTWFPQLYNAKK